LNRIRKLGCIAIACAGCLPQAAVSAFAQGTPGNVPPANQKPTDASSTDSSSPSSAPPHPANQAPAASQNAAETDFRCPRAADPRRRSNGCNQASFEWDQTLTLARGWEHVRKELKLIGITPTASYVGALQTNVTGGQDHVWSYAGQFTLGLSADFEELLRLKGLSAYVSFSWGTGSNLADTIRSSILPSTLYAPSYYLGEMYLQESLLQKRLTILAGRMAASDSFGALPAFTNYVTYGINPNLAPLTTNDDTFSGPPPGSQWGAQLAYLVTP